MFCPHCGKESPEKVKFCPHCGKDTRGAEAAKKPAEVPVRQAVEPAKPVKAPKPPKEKKPVDLNKVKKAWGKGILVSVIAFVLSIVIAGGSVALYFFAPAGGTGEPIPVAAAAENTAPSYDTDAMAKKQVDATISLGNPADDIQLSELTTDSQNVQSAISLGVAAANEEYTTLTPDTSYGYVSAVSAQVYELYKQNLIYDYNASSYGVEVVLHSGIRYMYSPTIEGYDAGTDAVLDIATYQPCVSGYDSSLSSYMTYPDDAASLIMSSLPMYSFDTGSDFDDSEVSLESLVTMANQHVIIWHGHGGYSYDVGSYLLTGIPVSEANDRIFYRLLVDGSLLKTSSNYCVTSKFFYTYLEDGSLENTVVYLGACSSGVDSRLADAFLDKGASAVYGNDNTIRTVYNLSMIKSTFEGLCKEYDEGGYYTVSDALEYAKEQNGYTDSRGVGAEVELFTDDDTFTLDWYEEYLVAEREVVLVLDSSGSMSGTPMNETKAAASAFVDSVLGEQAVVSVVSYDYGSDVLTGFTRRRQKLENAIDNLYAGGDTNIDSGLTAAYEMLKDGNAKKKIIILMSDGVANTGRVGDELAAYADEIRNEGIYIYALGFFHDLYDSEKAEAQSLMTDIADPGRYFDVDTAENLAFVFDDVAAQINGQRNIYIRIACPVDVEISYNGETLSKDNPRTSFGTISFVEPEEEEEDEDEVSSGTGTAYAYSQDSSVSEKDEEDTEDDLVKIVRLKEGVDYEVNIEGTGNGKMDYTIGFMDENGEYSDFREFKNVTITKRTKIDTVAAYTTLSTLNVDEDGDGDYDYIYTAEASSKAEVKEITFPWQFTLAIIFGSTAVLSLVLFIVCVKFSNKTKQKIAAEG